MRGVLNLGKHGIIKGRDIGNSYINDNFGINILTKAKEISLKGGVAMKKTLILLTICFVLGVVGCAGKGKVRIVGPDAGLTPNDAKVLKWHNRQELKLRSVLTGLEVAKSDLINVESGVLGKQEILKKNVFLRRKLINELMMQNQVDDGKLIDFGNYINRVREEKHLIDEEIEPIMSDLNKVSEDRRSLRKKSSVTGDKILDERTKLPEIPDSKTIYHNKKSRFSTLIIDIDALEVSPFSPFSNKAYSEENIYNEP